MARRGRPPKTLTPIDKEKEKLSDDMDISAAIVTNIKCGKVYKEISSNYSFPYLKSDIISDDIIKLICLDIQNKMKSIDIASKYNISPITIGHIRRRETYTYISKDYQW